MRLFPALPFFRLVPIDSPYSDEAVVRLTPPQYERVNDTEHEGPAGILWVDVEICHCWDRVPSVVSPYRCSVWILLPVQPFGWVWLQWDERRLRFMVGLRVGGGRERKKDYQNPDPPGFDPAKRVTAIGYHLPPVNNLLHTPPLPSV